MLLILSSKAMNRYSKAIFPLIIILYYYGLVEKIDFIHIIINIFRFNSFLVSFVT